MASSMTVFLKLFKPLFIINSYDIFDKKYTYIIQVIASSENPIYFGAGKISV